MIGGRVWWFSFCEDWIWCNFGSSPCLLSKLHGKSSASFISAAYKDAASAILLVMRLCWDQKCLEIHGHGLISNVFVKRSMEVFWMLWYLSWATQGNRQNFGRHLNPFSHTEALLLMAEKSCTTSLRYTFSSFFFPVIPNVNTSFGTGLRSDHSWIACHHCATRFLFEITWFLETSPNFFSRLSCRITVAQQYSPGIQSSLRFHSWPKGIFFSLIFETPWQTKNVCFCF